MTWSIFGDLAVALCLFIGALFTLVAGIGLLKLKDSMTRLHAPTKAGTLGTGALLTASMIHSYTYGDGSIHELLVLGFLFVTAPVSAHFIAKAVIHCRDCETPPPPSRDATWSTLDTPRGTPEIGSPTDPKDPAAT